MQPNSYLFLTIHEHWPTRIRMILPYFFLMASFVILEFLNTDKKIKDKQKMLSKCKPSLKKRVLLPFLCSLQCQVKIFHFELQLKHAGVVHKQHEYQSF